MKKSFKRRCFFFILGALIFGSISVVLTYSYVAGDVGFVSIASDWNVHNVQEALDNFRVLAPYCSFGCELEPGDVAFSSDYSGSEQTFDPECNGRYKLEIWGAQGGSGDSSHLGGYGGYSVGEISLTKDSVLYIHVGGAGVSTFGSNMGNLSGGYNGGGSTTGNSDGNSYWSTGGGATHIALVHGLLSTLESYKGTLINNEYYESANILLVAGGGAGGSTNVNMSMVTKSGSGGGQSGVVGIDRSKTSNPGTQTDGYAFGEGQSELITGGGGGFYGGYYGGYAAAGGSGYIASSTLVQNTSGNIVNKMYCYDCEESSDLHTYTVSTYGTTTHASERDTTNCPDGHSSSPISKCAKEGDGYVKITYLG